MVKTLIQAEFLKNSRGDAFIRFFDPAYVRADVIVLDRESKSLYAVLHEQEHLIGELDEDMLKAFEGNEEVFLTASHYHSGVVNLKAELHVCGNERKQ